MTPILYSYWRSSAAYRVRMALNLKQMAYDIVPVHLLNNGGEQRSTAHLARNPFGLVPALAIDGVVLSESLAIIDYLDETRPETPLLPRNPVHKAQARAFALHIACNIHPLNNLRVVQHLKANGWSEDQTADWTRHWMAEGFAGLERMVADHTGDWLFGDAPGVAECFLTPQMYNARRFALDLAAYPALADVDARTRDLPAVRAAMPEAQPDAPAPKGCGA
jgi:maleylacetoacetate isomerase